MSEPPKKQCGPSVPVLSLTVGAWIEFYGWRQVQDVRNIHDASRVLVLTNRGEFEISRNAFLVTEKPCAHTWEPDGTRSGGCIGLRCAICGVEDEKDVS
jgi:hypothetical protein